MNDAWWAAYRKLAGEPDATPRANSFAALTLAYRASPDWAGLKASTRRDYERYIKVIEDAWGAHDVRGVEPKHVLELRDSYADVPPVDEKLREKPLEKYADRKMAANHLLRTLSALIGWGIPRGYRTDNPCEYAPKFAPGDGYEAWPWRAIEHFQKHAKPHLWWVAAHALYTGQRQGDVLAMRRTHVRDGAIRVKQEKTDKPLWIPLHRDLRAVQEEMWAFLKRQPDSDRVVSTHLLVNTRGEGWTPDGFRASLGKELSNRVFRPLRKHRLVFHGLRKSAVVCLLEAGCTTAEVGAITGQTMEMVEHYAKQVNQQKLARAAILKWEMVKN